MIQAHGPRNVLAIFQQRGGRGDIEGGVVEQDGQTVGATSDEPGL
ncbi:MAG TPA: hypothetical protein VIZ18_19095 [Ktedonobacteraceae bacterium]